MHYSHIGTYIWRLSWWPQIWLWQLRFAPIDLACGRDNSWTVESTVTRFFSIVYTNKGKNWLESGGATYNFIATNNVKIALLTLNLLMRSQWLILLISLEISLLQLPYALMTYRKSYLLVTSNLTFEVTMVKFAYISWNITPTASICMNDLYVSHVT
jgi:hypothetical protein